MSLDKFLLDDIIYRYKHPKYRGSLPSSVRAQASNTSCGDEIDLYIQIKNNKIVDARFSGQMCAIANYGAELLCAYIINPDLADMKNLKNSNLLKTEQGSSLLCNPIRLKCFELAQHALANLNY